MLAPVALVLLTPRPAPLGFTWDLANGAGYLSLALCLLLFVYAGRARTFPRYSGRFFANLHRDLGYCALGLALAHAGLLLLREPLLVEHLKPTAPLHMLSGTLALLLMTLLVLSSLPRIRRRLWPDYHRFRHLHAVVSVCVAALTLYHVVESGYYLNHPWKVGLLVAVSAVLLVAYGLRRHGAIAGSVDRARNSARFSHLITYGAVLLAFSVVIGVLLFSVLGAQRA
jgi:DMSO/TMAO reductase YedYZ heme-binding membrane subunit